MTVDAHAQPTPDDKLTRRDRIEIGILDQLGNDEYDRRVNEWVSLDPASGRRVFYSEKLAIRTHEALGRLILASEQAHSRRRGDAARDADAHYQKLVQERAHAKLVRTTVRERQAKGSPRQQAYRVLGELYRDDLREILRRLRDGEDARAVLADLRRRRAA